MMQRFPVWWRKLLKHIRPQTNGIEFSGTNTHTGANTFSGASTFSGATTFTGAVTLNDLTKESFTNQATQLHFFDHFQGDLILDLWNNATTSSGTSTVTAGGGGTLVATTTGGKDDGGINFGSAGVSYDPSKGLFFETRMKLTHTGALSQWGLYKDANEYAMFEIDYATADIDLLADGGAGTATDSDSGSNADANYHIYGIYCDTSGAVHFYIDGTALYTSADGAVSTVSEGQLMGPHFFMTDSDTTANIMTIDYVGIFQESAW